MQKLENDGGLLVFLLGIFGGMVVREESKLSPFELSLAFLLNVVDQDLCVH